MSRQHLQQLADSPTQHRFNTVLLSVNELMRQLKSAMSASVDVAHSACRTILLSLKSQDWKRKLCYVSRKIRTELAGVMKHKEETDLNESGSVCIVCHCVRLSLCVWTQMLRTQTASWAGVWTWFPTATSPPNGPRGDDRSCSLRPLWPSPSYRKYSTWTSVSANQVSPRWQCNS